MDWQLGEAEYFPQRWLFQVAAQLSEWNLFKLRHQSRPHCAQLSWTRVPIRVVVRWGYPNRDCAKDFQRIEDHYSWAYKSSLEVWESKTSCTALKQTTRKSFYRSTHGCQPMDKSRWASFETRPQIQRIEHLRNFMHLQPPVKVGVHVARFVDSTLEYGNGTHFLFMVVWVSIGTEMMVSRTWWVQEF